MITLRSQEASIVMFLCQLSLNTFDYTLRIINAHYLQDLKTLLIICAKYVVVKMWTSAEIMKYV